jgi:hypothetical protein
MIFAAARQHPDSLADSRLTRQLFAYEMLAERRNQQDFMLWQAPALALTAQAFLLTIALGGNAVSVFAQALAAGLGCFLYSGRSGFSVLASSSAGGYSRAGSSRAA